MRTLFVGHQGLAAYPLTKLDHHLKCKVWLEHTLYVGQQEFDGISLTELAQVINQAA